MQTKSKSRRKVPCRCKSGRYCAKHYLYDTVDYKYAKGRDRESLHQACGGGVRIVWKKLEG